MLNIQPQNLQNWKSYLINTPPKGEVGIVPVYYAE